MSTSSPGMTSGRSPDPRALALEFARAAFHHACTVCAWDHELAVSVTGFLLRSSEVHARFAASGVPDEAAAHRAICENNPRAQQLDCIGGQNETLGLVPMNRTGPRRNELAMGLVETGELSGVVRHRGAKKEAEPSAVALAAKRGNRRVDLWSAHAAPRVAVRVELVHHGGGMARRQQGGPRGRGARHDPPVEPIDCSIECPVRSTGVDGDGTIKPPTGERVGFCIVARLSMAP